MNAGGENTPPQSTSFFVSAGATGCQKNPPAFFTTLRALLTGPKARPRKGDLFFIYASSKVRSEYVLEIIRVVTVSGAVPSA